MKKISKKDKKKDNFKSWTEYHEQKLSKTQSFSKVNRHIEEILESNDIENLINDLRKKFSISEEGLINSEEFDKCKSDKERDKVCDKNFKYFFENINRELEEEIEKQIPNSVEKYGLDDIILFDILKGKIAFDYEPMFLDDDGYNNLIIVDDILIETEGIKKEEADYLDEYLLKKYKVFPVALLISPYASERDIIDYVKKMYIYKIAPIQSNYKKEQVKINRIKKRNSKIRERDQFIYKNKDLPRQKIASMVMKKFGMDMDAGYVGKIISLENKKRKKV